MIKIQSKNIYSGLFQHLLLVFILVSIAGLFVQQKLLWRWDYLLYDAQLSFWTRSVSDDIIIIAIDDESLNQLGRWPWPRSTHAALINKIEKESPRVIGLDIIFSEPDSNDPQSDQLLAQAMKDSGKIVLPVFMSKQSVNSYPIEALPLPIFTQNAAALGHVHIDISDDGIARRVFLKEGIGEPHWMHYSLALLSVTEEAQDMKPELDESFNQYSSMQWSREKPFLIPYAGPPGHFQQIGYSQVLSGQYPKDLFRDKIVLIGTTAEGMGDALPTPLSGTSGIMPGVEIVANVVDAIRNDLSIHQPGNSWLILISIILVAIPLLIYPYLKPASTLLVLFGIILATITLVALLLLLFGIWIPLSTTLLFQLLSYPLWSWRRLDLAMRHINRELNQLTTRQHALSMHRERNLIDEIGFVSLFIPIKGWVILNHKGDALKQQGTAPNCNISQIKSNRWSTDGYRYWSLVNYQNQTCRLGLSLGMDAVITDDETRLLDNLIHTPRYIENDSNNYAEDLLQTKINQVQNAGIRYEQLRRIIDDSLSAMADGILICSSRGQVMLSNHRASWYLFADDNAEINGKSVFQVLSNVSINDGSSWKASIKSVLFNKERVITQAQHESGRDLMVELSPLTIIGDEHDGFVVNFSDISLLKDSERKRNEVLDFLSHDLRAPLSSMIAMIELSKNKQSIGEMRGMLTVMEKNTHKTLHLAEQFLQLSRANTDEKIKFYDIDFNNVVLNAMDQLWGLSDQSKVSIQHHFEHDECWTHAEPDLLERAIINLLSNAIKHSAEGSVVKVEIKDNISEITCCVIDHGAGIAAEELPHLFEMFRRVHGSGVERKQGIGLGLAFVDAVARRHSGHVDVESEVGSGSSFCLMIPKIEPIEDVLQ